MTWLDRSNGIHNEFVYSITEETNGDMYASGYGGVYRKSKKSKKSKKWENISFNLKPKLYRCVAADSKGNLFAMYSNEFMKLNKGDSAWRSLHNSYPGDIFILK